MELSIFFENEIMIYIVKKFRIHTNISEKLIRIS
jgi:hypothetical protein